MTRFKAMGTGRILLAAATLVMLAVSVTIAMRFDAEPITNRAMTVPVTRGPIERTLVLAGLVAYSDTATIGAPTMGTRLINVHVRAGASVPAGAPLMEFDGGRSASDLERRRMALVRAQLLLTKRESEGGDKVDLALARLDVEAAQRDLVDAQAVVDQLVPRAPFAGVVLQAPEPWGIGAAQPFMTIGRPESMVVDIEVDELDAASIRKDTPVDVTVGGIGWRSGGRVRGGPSPRRMRPQGAIFSFIVSLDSRAPSIFPVGTSATVAVRLESKTDALVVPRSAVVWSGQQAFVSRIRSGWTETVEIKTGVQNDELVEVIAGLEEGMVVVVAPLGTAPAGKDGA